MAVAAFVVTVRGEGARRDTDSGPAVVWTRRWRLLLGAAFLLVATALSVRLVSVLSGPMLDVASVTLGLLAVVSAVVAVRARRRASAVARLAALVKAQIDDEFRHRYR